MSFRVRYNKPIPIVTPAKVVSTDTPAKMTPAKMTPTALKSTQAKAKSISLVPLPPINIPPSPSLSPEDYVEDEDNDEEKEDDNKNVFIGDFGEEDEDEDESHIDDEEQEENISDDEESHIEDIEQEENVSDDENKDDEENEETILHNNETCDFFPLETISYLYSDIFQGVTGFSGMTGSLGFSGVTSTDNVIKCDNCTQGPQGVKGPKGDKGESVKVLLYNNTVSLSDTYETIVTFPYNGYTHSIETCYIITNGCIGTYTAQLIDDSSPSSDEYEKVLGEKIICIETPTYPAIIELTEFTDLPSRLSVLKIRCKVENANMCQIVAVEIDMNTKLSTLSPLFIA